MAGRCSILLAATMLSLSCLPGVAGADSDDPVYNRVAFTESAGTDVDNDILVATLYVQLEGQRSAALAREVNRIVDSAVDRAQRVDGVKVQTLSYRTNAIYNKSSVSGWRVSQSIRLESRDSERLGELVGELQDAMQVQSIGYQVSEESRRSHADRLLEAALARFNARAERIRVAMGRRSLRVVRININTGEGGPVIQPRAMLYAERMSVQAAAPRIEAGTQRLTVRVDGEIELSND